MIPDKILVCVKTVYLHTKKYTQLKRNNIDVIGSTQTENVQENMKYVTIDTFVQTRSSQIYKFDDHSNILMFCY